MNSNKITCNKNVFGLSSTYEIPVWALVWNLNVWGVWNLFSKLRFHTMRSLKISHIASDIWQVMWSSKFSLLPPQFYSTESELHYLFPVYGPSIAFICSGDNVREKRNVFGLNQIFDVWFRSWNLPLNYNHTTLLASKFPQEYYA